MAAAIDDHAAVTRMINEQTEVVVLLAGPMVLFVMALTPWIVEILYARNFQAAATVLRFQLMGDILKVCSWPLGIIIIASGQGRTFIGTEITGSAVYVLLTWLLLPVFGLAATGIAFFGMYLVYLPLTYFLVTRKMRISWERRILVQLSTVFVLAALVFLIASWSKWYGASIGVAATAFLAVKGLVRIRQMTNLRGNSNRIAEYAQKIMKKIGVRHE